MTKKTRIGMAIVFALLVSAFVGSAAFAGGPWTGDPDPYACNVWGDCEDMVKVCIANKNHAVGIYYDPASQTNEFMVADAVNWSGIALKMGECTPGFSYTGRWAHVYQGTTWWCTLLSEPGVDKDTPRFSNPKYVDFACGVHDDYGDFVLVGEAEDYLLCREMKFSPGDFGCGNHYDTTP
jgi:hypothetical protein